MRPRDRLTDSMRIPSNKRAVNLEPIAVPVIAYTTGLALPVNLSCILGLVLFIRVWSYFRLAYTVTLDLAL